MASKAPQVQESVVERRLRPIYDYLDTANNKKALQECDKVLKKSPNLQCVKALRAVCLLRLGKEADSVAILEGLTLELTIDDPTILAMSICYRELQQYSKVCMLYERAVKADPNNEESHTQLFMSYVRVGNFKAQHQAALALFKHKPKNPYYCWAVMSVILQATRGPESLSPQKRALLLSLAEKMIDKLENKFQADQEVQLFHLVLRLQNKHAEILELLDGPFGCKVSGDTQYNRLSPLRALNRWRDVNLTCKRILCEHVDNWAVWKEYLESVFYLRNLISSNNGDEDVGKTNGNIGDEREGEDDLNHVDDSADKAHEFICRVIEMEATNAYCLRGPYLARFELARHLQSTSFTTRPCSVSDILGSLPDLFVEYFRRFGQRPSCVPDLRVHLSLLSDSERLEVATTCLGARDFNGGDKAAEGDERLPKSEIELLRHIHAHQLGRLCSHFDLIAPAPFISSLMRYYAHGNSHFRLDRLSTDLGPADPYVILAAQTLADNRGEGMTCSQQLVEAVKLLDELAEESKSNFHGKLLAIRYFHMLGGSLGAAQIYDSLDVKHLQLDSLGFLHCARLPATGLITHANHIYENTLKFFTSNYKDNMDHLTFLYKYGSFMKLDEFMDFQERMGNSLHFATINAEKHIINLLQCINLDTLYSFETNYSKETLPKYELLRDNSDYNVYQSFDSERVTSVKKIDSLKEVLFKSDVALLQVRHGVLNALQAAILLTKMAAMADNRQHNLHINNLQTVVQTLQADYDRILVEQNERLQLKEKDFSCILLPFPSRLDCILDVKSVPLILSSLQFFLSVQSDDCSNQSSQIIAGAILSSLSAMSSFLSAHINAENSGSDIFSTRRATLEIAVNVVEVLNLVSILIVLTLEVVKDKRSKKLAKIRELVQNVALNLKETLNCADSALVSWNSGGSLVRDDVATLTDKMQSVQLTALVDAALLPSKFSVHEQLFLSHVVAVKELRAVLRAKIKMLP